MLIGEVVGKEWFCFSAVVVLTASHSGGADKNTAPGETLRSGLHFRARN